MVEQLPAEEVAAAIAVLAKAIAKAMAAMCSGAVGDQRIEGHAWASASRCGGVRGQSTMVQIVRNRESTARQDELVARAVESGLPCAGVRVIDEDLGVLGPAPRVGPGSPSWPRRSGLAR